MYSRNAERLLITGRELTSESQHANPPVTGLPLGSVSSILVTKDIDSYASSSICQRQQIQRRNSAFGIVALRKIIAA